MKHNNYVPTDVDRELIHLLMKVYRNRDFVTKMWVNLENEQYRAEMIRWLRNNPGVNDVDVIGKMLDITMKADLVEAKFYEINPELKN